MGTRRLRANRLLFFILCAAVFAVGARSARSGEEAFSWRQCAGQTLRLMLNRHPYAEWIKRKLGDFERLTGVRVAFAMHPEDRYFARLDESFDNPFARPDVYMTGVYQSWGYATRGRMLALDGFIANPSLTRRSYNIDDFFPRVIGAFRWSGRVGAPLGEGPLWAIPIGFEASALTCNREVLARFRLPVPRTLEELTEAGRQLSGFDGPGSYGVAVRAPGGWNALHSAYIAAFANYGATDFAVEDGRLVSRVNSPEAVAATELWVEMLRSAGPPDRSNHDWYRCLEDIGSRRAAFLFDADILGFFANAPGASGESGKLGLAPPPAPAASGAVRSNLWVWGLAVNPRSENPDAAWLLVQYLTGQDVQTSSVLEWHSVNPPRRSVFENPRFQAALSTMHGYAETFSQLVDNTSVLFTPTPLFFEIATRWSEVLRGIADGEYASAQEGMDRLKEWMDERMADVAVEEGT